MTPKNHGYTPLEKKALSSRIAVLRKSLTGYTIVEVMIFLAVSAVLFTSVVGVYTIRNRRVQFAEAVQTFDQKVKDVLNDVATGYFPSASSINCKKANNTIEITPAVNKEQGSNQGCVFAGKIIQFTQDSSAYDIYTLAADKGAETVADAKFRAVPFLKDTGTLSAGVVVTDVHSSNGSEGDRTAIASLSSFGAELPPNFTATSGLNNRTLLSTIGSRVAADGGVSIDNGNVNESRNGLVICLREAGSGGRTASILIGGQAGNSTRVKIDGGCSGPQ